MNREEQFYERIVLLLLLAGAAFLYINAGGTTAAAGTDMASMDFPKKILALLAVLCILRLSGNLICMIKKQGGEGKLFVDRRTWQTILCVLVYAALWNVLGFCLSSVLFFFTETLVLRQGTGKKQAVLVALGVTVTVYVLFGVAFGVDFPEPLFELLAG